jgi:archaellum component FlaC
MDEIFVIEALAKEHFEKSPDSQSFEIPKGVLGSKLGVGTTKTLAVCQELASEYPFVQNVRGGISIDKKGFLDFERLMEEKANQISTIDEIKARYPLISKQIDEAQERIGRVKEALEAKENQGRDISRQADEMEEKIKEIDKNISEISPRLEALRQEYEAKSIEYKGRIESEINALEENARKERETFDSKLGEAKRQNVKAKEENSIRIKELQEIESESRMLRERNNGLTSYDVYQARTSGRGKTFYTLAGFCLCLLLFITLNILGI